MTVSNAQLQASWTITPNVRNVFVSLNDSAANFIFQNFTACLATGFTVKWTCDGTTGPTGAGDTTNRLLGKANCTTRGANAAAAQSYYVIQNTEGVQIGVFYQGGSDDVVRIGYSPTGLYTLASPTTNQPTATDEVAITVGNSLVNGTTNGDRILQIWVSSGGKNWSCAIFRQNALVNVVGVERVNDLTAPGVFTLPYVGYRLSSATRGNGNGLPTGSYPNIGVGTSGHVGIAARIVTSSSSRITRLGGGDISMTSAGQVAAVGNSMASTPPATTAPAGGSPFIPIIWSGELVALLDGFVGWPIDWWQQFTSVIGNPAAGTFSPGYDVGDTPGVSPVSPRTNWYVAVGSAMVRPWKNAAPSFDMT